jgi:hypothetical protein
MVIIILKMRANSAERNCYKIVFLLMVIAMVALIILSIVNLVDLHSMQDRINYCSSSLGSCFSLCQDYHTYSGIIMGLCCDYTLRDCIPLEYCRIQAIGYCQDQYDHDLMVIIISSIANAILIVGGCCLFKRMRQPVPVELLLSSGSAPINHINKSEATKKNERYYDSFVYVDTEITCVVCIETFN